MDESVDTLLRIIAALLRRHGGEVVMTQREIDIVDGLPVLIRQLAPGQVRLRLVEQHEICEEGCCIDLDED